MNQNEYREFLYLDKEDCDRKVKINGEDVNAYSEEKVNELYPGEDYVIVGETIPGKRPDREHNIGRIELNGMWLYVDKKGTHNRLFKKHSAFVEVSGGGYIALCKTRLLPVIALIVLLLCSVSGSVYGILGLRNAYAAEEIDPGIRQVSNEIIPITGTVTKGDEPVSGAKVSLQQGNEEVGTTTTDEDGNYLISDVEDGNYNLVITYEDSTLTKSASVEGAPVTADCRFPSDDLHDVGDITDNHNEEDLPESQPSEKKSEVKAVVKIPEGTPPVAVGGLDLEAMLHMSVGKAVDITLLAEKLEEEKIPDNDKTAITGISGELDLCYYDFSVLREVYKDKVLESSEYLKNTKTVLEIAVPYDSSRSVGTYVFRCHNGAAGRFEELAAKPSDGFRDGTCYVTKDTVYVYTSCFSTYSIGSAKADRVVRGSDTITYSDKAVIDLTTGKITMLYRHDEDSTNEAKVELYLAGDNSNLLVAKSGKIPAGYQIGEMTLMSGITNMPSVGTYNGLMKIIYLGTDGSVVTNVEIPLSVAITR